MPDILLGLAEHLESLEPLDNTDIMDLSQYPEFTPQAGRKDAQRILMERSLFIWFTKHFGEHRPCYSLIAKAVTAGFGEESTPEETRKRLRDRSFRKMMSYSQDSDP